MIKIYKKANFNNGCPVVTFWFIFVKLCLERKINRNCIDRSLAIKES